MNFMLLLIELPGFELHIELLRRAYERSASIPAAFRLTVFGKKLIVAYLAIPDWLVFEVNAGRRKE